MTPVAAADDMFDTPRLYAHASGYRRSGFSRGYAAARFQHLLFCEFGKAIIFSFEKTTVIANILQEAIGSGLRFFGMAISPCTLSGLYSTFRIRIPSVISCRPKEEMIRVAACRVIATVANKKPEWIPTVDTEENNPSGLKIISAEPKSAIALDHETSFPWPALIWSADIDLAPKAKIVRLAELWDWLKLKSGHREPSYGSRCLPRRSVHALRRGVPILAAAGA